MTINMVITVHLYIPHSIQINPLHAELVLGVLALDNFHFMTFHHIEIKF